MVKFGGGGKPKIKLLGKFRCQRRSELLLFVVCFAFGSGRLGTTHQHDHIESHDQQERSLLRLLAPRSVALRPLLMQSDLQSVGDGAIGTFTRAFAPKMCETAAPRLRMTWTVLQDLSRAVSRFSRYPVTGNHLRYFSDPTGSNTTTTRDRIGKYIFFRSNRGL